MEGITFSEALEIIESLPEEQRETLIQIVQHRLIEQRRERLAQSIVEARQEYERGEIRQGTASDLMSELSEADQSKPSWAAAHQRIMKIGVA